MFPSARKKTPRKGASRLDVSRGDSFTPSSPSTTRRTLAQVIAVVFIPHLLLAPFAPMEKRTGSKKSAVPKRITSAPNGNIQKLFTRATPKRPARPAQAITTSVFFGSFLARCIAQLSSPPLFSLLLKTALSVT